MTLVGPLSCVTASVDNQVALELENLATELTGFGFSRGLVLTLVVRRARRTMSPLNSRWLWGIGQKCWGLGTRLEKCGTQQAVHGWYTVG